MSKIALIDLDSIVFSIGYSKDKIEKTEDQLKADADSIMTNILNWTNSTGYIAFIKGKNTIKSRLKVNPSYKANRSGEIPPYWCFVKQYLISKWKAIEVHNLEVDDEVNISCLKIKDSFRVAIDKDLLNLEGLNYNWRKNQWLSISKEEASHYFWKSMLKGDQVDGVVGIPGIGEVKAKKLLDDPINDYQAIVLRGYTNYFGEELGIENFYKNYVSLKIKEVEENNFVTPPIQEWRSNEFQSKVEREEWN